MATAAVTAPTDSISIDPEVTYENHTFTITGTASSSVGLRSVTINADEQARPTVLGTVTPDANGNFSLTVPIGNESFSGVYATETDNQGYVHTAQSDYTLNGFLFNQKYDASQDNFDKYGGRTTTTYFKDDGSIEGNLVYSFGGSAARSTTFHEDGSGTVNIDSSGQTIPSNYFDTFLNHNHPSNTFVFDPGHGLDIIQQFHATGADHDTISLLRSDFNSIADVLRHTQSFTSGSVIHDPTSGDTIRLPGVSKTELISNRQDIAFHG